MNNIEVLIQQYCPNGVEYIPLGKVCGFISGFAFKASLFHKEGVPVCKTTNIQQDAIDFSNMEYFHLDDYDICLDRYIIMPQDIVIGMSGTIKVGINNSNRKCYLNQRVGKFSPNKEVLNNKYLFYILLNSTDTLCEGITGGSVKNLSNNDINNLEIPIPPLPIQEEIVRVLDTFTELQAELQAELKKRLQQYNYYRDNLLSFDGEHNLLWGLIKQHCPDGVEYHKVKDVYKRLKGTPITAGKMKEINTPGGAIRVFAGGKTVIDANEEDIPNANITRVPAVLVQSRGVIDAVYYDKPFTFKNEMWAYTAKDIPAVKYLYYVLKANIQTFRDAASGMGSLPQISLGVTEDYIIPVPPLPVQQKIVDVLDRFDALTTDLAAGLPAEIEKRRLQYEFYRDKLLTFKRKEA